MSGEAVRTPTPIGPPSKSEGGFVSGVELHRSALAVLYLANREAELPGSPRYVLRRLLPEHAHDAELRALLLREKFVASQVRSRHLTSVVSTFDGPVPFTVMEYVEGFSLEELLRRAAGQTHWVRFLVPAVVDALAALAALHAVRDGQNGAPALSHQAPVPRHILFGLDGIARLTDLTQCLGPGLPWSLACSRRLRVWEMAPEQVLAPAHVDHRCDIFVAGATLWRVLTGNALFQASSPQETLQRIMRASIPSLQEAGVPMDGGMDRVLRQALARSRHQRLDSAAEFCEALRRHAQQAGLWAERHEIVDFLAAQWTAHMLVPPSVVHMRPTSATRANSEAPPESGVSPLPAPPPATSGAHAGRARFAPSRPPSLPPLIVRPEPADASRSTLPGMPAVRYQDEGVTGAKSFGATQRAPAPHEAWPDPLLGHTIDPHAGPVAAAPYAEFSWRAEPQGAVGEESWERARANADYSRAQPGRSEPSPEPWPPSGTSSAAHLSDAAPLIEEQAWTQAAAHVQEPVAAERKWSLQRVTMAGASALLLGAFIFLVVADLAAPSLIVPAPGQIDRAPAQAEPSLQAGARPGEGAIAPAQPVAEVEPPPSRTSASAGQVVPAPPEKAVPAAPEKPDAEPESARHGRESESTAPARARRTSSQSGKAAKAAQSEKGPSPGVDAPSAPVVSSPTRSWEREPEWLKRTQSPAEPKEGPRVPLPDNPY